MNKHFKLSKIERDFLSVCQLCGDVTLAELGRKAKMAPHTARRVMQKFLKSGILRPYPIINHFALGKFEIGLYINILNEEDGEQPSIKIDNIPEIAAMTRLGGRFNYCIDMIVANPAALDQISTTLYQGKKRIILDQEVVIRTKRTVFQRKFFSRQTSALQCISLSPKSAPQSIDEEETRLLQLLAQKPQATLAQYGSHLGYSAAGIAHKLNSLRKRGVLIARAYAVIALKMNLFVYRVLLTVRALSKAETDSFTRFCQQDPATVTLTECLGAWNFEIRVEFFTSDGISEFRTRLEKILGRQIQRIEIIPFLGTTYMSGYSP